jgi:vacuolar-type H+-ATPase subunit F/Vma7
MGTKHPIYAMGSKFFVLGFKGAGASPIVCEEPSDVLAHLKRGIYVVEPELAKPIQSQLERINSTNPDITIIVYGTESLQRQIERATGMVLG